jgi:L-iditol 2-dehydrogenase
VGYIDALGEGVTHLDLGQRVVIEPNFPCGHCRYCRRGQGNICPNKRITGVNEPDCFAEYSVLPTRFAWSLPEHIRDEDAVLVEPTAAGWHALQTATLRPGDTIAVIGLGAIGLLLTHTALAVGHKVLVTDQVLEKTALAERWGATAIQLEAGEEVMPQLAAQLDATDVVAVFECGGTVKREPSSPAKQFLVVVSLPSYLRPWLGLPVVLKQKLF